jgi:hypothetical protein
MNGKRIANLGIRNIKKITPMIVAKLPKPEDKHPSCCVVTDAFV